MKEHLYHCEAYLEAPANSDSWIVKDVQRHQNNDTAPTISHQGTKQQTTLTPLRMSLKEQAECNHLAAMEIYCDGRVPNLFEGQYLQALLQRLNSAWKISSAKTFAAKLLDKEYEAMKKLVLSTLLASGHINFVTDGSSDINHNQIKNLSALTQIGALQLVSGDIPGMVHNANVLAGWTYNQFLDWTGGNLAKVNSLATDTEEKMQKMWKALASMPGLSHVFFVPCDSHGLQLLMKDIAGLAWFKELFHQAQAIPVYFHKADKQLSILRGYQQAEYGRTYAVTMSCITRWGTQVC